MAKGPGDGRDLVDRPGEPRPARSHAGGDPGDGRDLYDAAIYAALDFSEDEAAGFMDEYAAMVSNHIDSLLRTSATRR